MFKKIITVVGISVPLVLASLKFSYAAGIGLGVNGGVSRSSIAEETSLSSTYAVQFTEYFIGASIIVDSNVGRDSLFNYRLLLGYDNLIFKEYKFFDEGSYHRFSMVHSFGFGFVRTRFLRIWAGPQLGLTYELAYADGIFFDPYMYGFLGPVLGFNFNPGDVFTLSVEIGVRAGYGGHLSHASERGMKVEPYATAGIIFRIGETFGPSDINDRGL